MLVAGSTLLEISCHGSYCFVCLFVCFYFLHPSQQVFSHVWTGLPGLSTKQWIKCLAQGHNTMTPLTVRLKQATFRSPVYHSTNWVTALLWNVLYFKFTIIHELGHLGTRDIVIATDFKTCVLKRLLQPLCINISSLPLNLSSCWAEVLVIDDNEQSPPMIVEVVLIWFGRSTRTDIVFLWTETEKLYG